MRADRLLSILMLLQSQGRMTARELAEELEVSERTIYRDVDALGMAGVPVYTEKGPGGGITLVERYRSDLTGLTQHEIRALFMLGMPPALAELGLDRDLRAALLKLAASLPTASQENELDVRQRLYIDLYPWEPQLASNRPTSLQVLQQGVWESLELEIYHLTFIPMGEEAVRSVVYPYGLVAKAEYWYLVAWRDDHLMVVRADRIQHARPTGRTFQRPVDFDLIAFWRTWCLQNQENRSSFLVHLRVSPQIAASLEYFFGGEIRRVYPSEADGWTPIEVVYDYHEQARGKLLAFGGAVEIVDPPALRYSVQDYATQILRRYTERTTG
jgi:predicted DNA-binding transcriptional regulator YafY